MTKEDLLSAKEQIAKFMGASNYLNIPDIFIYPMFENPAPSKNSTTTHTIEELKYDSSWDWQIPVWKKLYAEVTSKIGDQKLLKEFMIYTEWLRRMILLESPEAAFEVLSEVMQWWKTQNKK